MSAKRRAAGPVRQLSLQQQQQQQQQSPLARRSLRRQQSEDQGLCVTACSIRNGVNSGGSSDELNVGSNKPATSQIRPRLVKVAWAERRQNSQQSPTPEVEVVARRCTSQPRPTLPPQVKTSNLPSISADRDSILYTRQQLAERLRRAWKEREQSKPNLDIFLAHNSVTNVEEESSPRPASALSAPNIIESLSPTIQRSRASPLNSPSRGIRRQFSNVYDSKTVDLSIVSTASIATSAATAITTTCNTSSTVASSKALDNVLNISLHNELGNKSFIDTADDTSISEVSSSSVDIFNVTPVRTTTSFVEKRNALHNAVTFNSEQNIKGETQKEGTNSKTSKCSTSKFDNREGTEKSYSSQDITTDTESNLDVYGNDAEDVEIVTELFEEPCITTQSKQIDSEYPLREIRDNENRIIHEIVPTSDNSSLETQGYSSLEPDNMATADKKITLPDNSKDFSFTEVPLSSAMDTNIDSRKTAVLANDKENSNTNKMDVVASNYLLPVPTTSESSSLISNYKLFFPAASKVQDSQAEQKAKQEEKSKETSNTDACTPVARINCGIRPPQPQSVAKDRGNVGGSIPAAVRRVNFRNNAFNKTISDRFQAQGSNHPALTRTLSAPSQRSSVRDPPLTKGILVKTAAVDSTLGSDGEEDSLADLRADRERLIKSAPAKRRLKSAFAKKKSRSRGEESSGDEGEEVKSQAPSKDKEKEKKKGGRRGIVRGAEIVTMVSLMSPTASEAEEESSETFLQPPKENDSSWLENRESTWPGIMTAGQSRENGGGKPSVPSRVVCLRKSPKSVSFQQQPSISASYPSRRGSMVIQQPQQEQTTLSTSPVPPAAELRRRLIRTKSVATKNVECEPPVPTNTTEEPLLKSTEVVSSPPSKNEAAVKTEVPIQVTAKPSPNNPDQSANTGKDEDNEPKFQTPKERECWNLYRRMCEKGVSISYDTVLRGMLTPTEYRLHRSTEPSTC